MKNTSKVNGEEYIKHLETYLGKIKGVYREKISLDLPMVYIEGENFNSLVTNGADESPYYKGTKLCGAFVYPPTAQVDVKLYNFKNGNENAYIYNVMPIYKEEISGDDFFDLMGEEGIDQIIRKDRKNLCENM